MNVTLPTLEGTVFVSPVLFVSPGVGWLASCCVDGAALFVFAFVSAFVSTRCGFTLEPWTITRGMILGARSSETAKLLSELPFASEWRLESVKRLLGVLFIPRSSKMDTSSDHRSLLG
jgi:hypothetical protein